MELKHYYLLLLSLCISNTQAQTLVTLKGATATIAGNTQLVLKNASWENNGQFDPGNSVIALAGENHDTLKGRNVTSFQEIRINKGTGKLTLESDIQVEGNLHFISGIMDLNDKTLFLNNTLGGLNGESELSRITGPNGGKIEITQDLNNVSNLNPGNIGLAFTTSDNLGSTLIRRGHMLPGISGTEEPKVERYFEVISTHNAPSVTLRFYYLDAEVLSGTPETNFQLFHSTNGGDSWAEVGKSSQDTVENWIEQVGLEANGLWKIGTTKITFPFPILTTIPDDIIPDLLDIEMPVAHKNTGHTHVTHSETYNLPEKWNVYPNPATHKVSIEIPTLKTKVEIRIYDLSGKIIWQVSPIPGAQIVEIPLQEDTFATGIYLVNIAGPDINLTKRIEVIP